jgi:aspartate kinase
MYINIFKFGGAAMNSAKGIKNVAAILRRFSDMPLLTVVSAMGKTTNALEELLRNYMRNDPVAVVESYEKIRDYHFSILNDLFDDKGHVVFGEVDSLFNQLRGYIRKGHLYTPDRHDFDFEYDQIVSYGELIATTIFHQYLVSERFRSALFDVRDLIKTDSTYRDARIDWQTSEPLIQTAIRGYFTANPRPGSIALTQGFLGCDPAGNTTTLGREGSDFSAAVFAWCLKTGEMTIWKDVPGVMNADPKWMSDPVCLPELSYREAVELAYYGASVIHPKTIKPLENANIVLHVKSFAAPESPGTTVKNMHEWKIPTPVFIRKTDQMLISVSARDFSFILEDNLSIIFRTLAEFRVKVNVMHNSAISFSICVDADPLKIDPLLDFLQRDYEIRYNAGLELYTIRHYSNEAITRIVTGREVKLELRSRNTIQLVLA